MHRDAGSVPVPGPSTAEAVSSPWSQNAGSPKPALPPRRGGVDGEESKEREDSYDATWPRMQGAGPTLLGGGAEV